MLLPTSTTPTDIGVPAGIEFDPESTYLVDGVSAVLLWLSKFGSIVAIGRICSESLGRGLVDMTLHYVRHVDVTS